MSARSWTLVIPAPGPWLNANDRHKRRPDAAIKAWRDAANVYARAAKMPKLGAVRITATLQFTDRRRRDAPNYYPTIKAAIDGLIDGEVLDDDADGLVRSLTIEPGAPLARKPYGPAGQMVLTIWEVT